MNFTSPKRAFKRLSAITLLVLASFTTMSVVRPAPAQAIVGGAGWPVLFPLIVVGGVLEIAAAGVEVAALVKAAEGYDRRAVHLAWSGLTLFLVGLVFLDDKEGTGTVQTLTTDQQKEYGLSDAELVSYNDAVANQQMQQIFEEAALELNQQGATADNAKSIMTNLLGALPEDAHHAFTKIALHLSKKAVQN